jgi:hypothetical protein
MAEFSHLHLHTQYSLLDGAKEPRLTKDPKNPEQKPDPSVDPGRKPPMPALPPPSNDNRRPDPAEEAWDDFLRERWLWPRPGCVEDGCDCLEEDVADETPPED